MLASLVSVNRQYFLSKKFHVMPFHNKHFHLAVLYDSVEVMEEDHHQQYHMWDHQLLLQAAVKILIRDMDFILLQR